MIASFTVLVILLAGETHGTFAGRTWSNHHRAIWRLRTWLFQIEVLVSAPWQPIKSCLGSIVLVAIFSLQFALYRVFERFPDPLSSDRPVIASTTIEAARAYMPLGSGLGSFVPVYAMFEKPEDAQDTYVNRAHNDFLEVWLEAGVLGLALIGLFVVWLVRRSVEIWRSAPAPGASQLDWSLVRAQRSSQPSSSPIRLVDFPLRTGAMMAIMAFACALLIEPPVGAVFQEEGQLQAVPRRTRHRERHA